jgi:hypothetical protein
MRNCFSNATLFGFVCFFFMNWNLQAELGKPSILHPDQGKFPFLLTVAQLRSLRLRLVICSCHWIKMKNNQQSDTSFFRCLMHGNMIMESISEFLDLFFNGHCT